MPSTNEIKVNGDGIAPAGGKSKRRGGGRNNSRKQTQLNGDGETQQKKVATNGASPKKSSMNRPSIDSRGPQKNSGTNHVASASATKDIDGTLPQNNEVSPIAEGTNATSASKSRGSRRRPRRQDHLRQKTVEIIETAPSNVLSPPASSPETPVHTEPGQKHSPPSTAKADDGIAPAQDAGANPCSQQAVLDSAPLMAENSIDNTAENNNTNLSITLNSLKTHQKDRHPSPSSRIRPERVKNPFAQRGNSYKLPTHVKSPPDRASIASEAGKTGTVEAHLPFKGDLSRTEKPLPHMQKKVNDFKMISDLPPQVRDVIIPIPHQCEFVDQMALYHVYNSDVITEELLERENMRRCLQEICKEVVSLLAAQTNPEFDANTVMLRCFGSLRSGFATRASDMDLALTSPVTEADSDFDDTKIPKLLEFVLLQYGYGARLLTRTRVPILKVCQNPGPELLEDLKAEYLNKHTNEGDPNEGQSHKNAPSPHTNGKSKEDRPGETNTNEENHLEEASAIPKGLQGKSDEELLRLFALALREGWYSPEHREIIAEFNKQYETSGGDSNNPQLVQARIALRQLPDVLSRYREPRVNNLEFPKHGVGIQCDINFSNYLAIHNTALLRCYNLCDDRIRQMGVFVKAWAKRRDINTPYNGTLSSYGYVLMVLHYAVNIAKPPLAPNLQLQLGPNRGGAPDVERSCNGYNVQFWRNEQQIQWCKENGMMSYNRESLGSLLRGFFHYFAEQGHHVTQGGFNWTREVLSLRTEGGLLSKEHKGWTGARTDTIAGANGEKPIEVRQRYLFAIEDPFEIDHNVGRPVAHNGIVAIRDEFRRANRIVRCGGIIDGISYDLLAENQHTELDRGNKFFSGNPGKPRFSGPSPEEFREAGPTKKVASSRLNETTSDSLAGPYGQVRASHLQMLRESAGMPNEGLVEAGLIGSSRELNVHDSKT